VNFVLQMGEHFAGWDGMLTFTRGTTSSSETVTVSFLGSDVSPVGATAVGAAASVVPSSACEGEIQTN
jgi:hypothetical protein